MRRTEFRTDEITRPGARQPRRPLADALAILGTALLAYGVYGVLIRSKTGACEPDCGDTGESQLPIVGVALVCLVLARVANARWTTGRLLCLTSIAVGVGSLAAGVNADGAAVDTGVAWWFAGIFIPGGVLPLAFVALRRRATEEFIENARAGRALVLDVQDTGWSVNDNPRVRLELGVTPADGSPRFTVTEAIVVSRLRPPRPGETYEIRYHARKRNIFLLGDRPIKTS